MTLGRVLRPKIITRDDVRNARQSAVFVFGDNMIGRGMGGQAAAMRGEPNSIGIPTKWAPNNRPGSFFCDDDWKNGDIRHAIFGALDRMDKALAEGLDVVIPADGVGTGLAMLPQKAPVIFRYIAERIAKIQEGANVRQEDSDELRPEADPVAPV